MFAVPYDDELEHQFTSQKLQVLNVYVCEGKDLERGACLILQKKIHQYSTTRVDSKLVDVGLESEKRKAGTH